MSSRKFQIRQFHVVVVNDAPSFSFVIGYEERSVKIRDDTGYLVTKKHSFMFK